MWKAKTEFFEEDNGWTSHAHAQMLVVLFSHINKSSLSIHVDGVNAAKKVVWTRIIPKIYYCEYSRLPITKTFRGNRNASSYGKCELSRVMH